MTAPTVTRGGMHLPTGIGRWVRPLGWAAVVVAVVVLLAVYVFPTRTWLEQQRSLDEASATLADLDAEKDALEARLAELDSDGEIEQMARSQFGLVKPGEEAYAVLPAPEPPVDIPSLWPYGDVDAPAATATAVPGAPLGDDLAP